MVRFHLADKLNLKILKIMEIPQNEKRNDLDIVVERVIETLKNKDTHFEYRLDYYVPSTLAEEVCRSFVKKGYHAKMIYFVDGRASYQSFVISKKPLDESRAMMVYSVVYG